MEITPGRAPFTEDEDYTPLRKPKSATTTPTHEPSASFNVGGGGAVSGSGYSSQMNDVYQRTTSPSKLSPFAQEFVPRFVGSGGGGIGTPEQRQQQQRQQQQQYNQQNYQQYQPRQQRYANGYQQNHHHQHQQHQTNAPHHQQQQQMYGTSQMATLTASVQERLKIGSGGSAGSGQRNFSNNYYQQQRHTNKHHNHQQRYQHSSHAQHQQASTSSGGGGSVADGGSEVETIALDYLQTVIQCLNQNPGQFDTIATRFLTIFDGMEHNQYVLSNAMEDIFQESIQNPNFRYMGAKLYNLLHMLNLKKDSLFHTLLKCKLDYHQSELLQYMQSAQQQKVRETALFLAELYMQLRGDDSRIHLIAENIVYALKQLLSKETTDNVRCICLTLKLAGYDLTADCPVDMRGIIAQLDAINVQSAGKYPLAANVISLQKNNWGRKVSASNSMCDPELAKPPEPLRTSDEPIFYGPDGRELTAEENEFLSGGATGGGAGSTDDDEDIGDLDMELDPEMDEETERAYKEFCKLNAST